MSKLDKLNAAGKLIAGGLLFVSSFLSLPAEAMTQEQKSQHACEAYAQVGKQQNPSEYFVNCKQQNRSPEEWDCMKKRRYEKEWAYMDAVNACFKDAPALHAIKRSVKFSDELKASDMCRYAMAEFENHGEKSAIPPEKLCELNERTAIMWACMTAFAEGGNSFMYAAGQCFPRIKPSNLVRHR